MSTLIIIAAALTLFALLRFGVTAEFGGDGLCITARIGVVPVRIIPRKQRVKKVKKRKKPEKEKEKKPGKLSDYSALIPAVKTSLGRVRRRLLIRKVTVHYIAAGDDAYKTAMSFGAANAAFSLVTPVLENFFRVRRRDFRTSADFEANEPYIFIEAAISLAVWEAIYIAICLIPPLFKKKPEKITVRKENEGHGKASDKRIDGSHNAEDTGNGGR